MRQFNFPAYNWKEKVLSAHPWSYQSGSQYSKQKATYVFAENKYFNVTVIAKENQH